MLDIDFEQYCEECTNSHLGTGLNSEKEASLRRRWALNGGKMLHISSPTTIVDNRGIVAAWALQDVLLPGLQVFNRSP